MDLYRFYACIYKCFFMSITSYNTKFRCRPLVVCFFSYPEEPDLVLCYKKKHS